MILCLAATFVFPQTINLADFENQANEICSHLSEKASNGRFLKPEKLQNHSSEGKGMQKKNERGEGKEEKRKKQWLHCYSFSNKKTVGHNKVSLAIRLSKIRLEK